MSFTLLLQATSSVTCTKSCAASHSALGPTLWEDASPAAYPNDESQMEPPVHIQLHGTDQQKYGREMGEEHRQKKEHKKVEAEMGQPEKVKV